MHYFSPFHKTIETAIYRKWGEGQEYRFNWYPPFLITLKMKTCNDRIAIYLLNCELNFCICSGFSELCTYLLLLNFNISIGVCMISWYSLCLFTSWQVCPMSVEIYAILSHQFSRRIPEQLSFSYTENPWYCHIGTTLTTKAIVCKSLF